MVVVLRIGSHEDVGHDGGHEDGNSPLLHITILKFSPTFCKLFRSIQNLGFLFGGLFEDNRDDARLAA